MVRTLSHEIQIHYLSRPISPDAVLHWRFQEEACAADGTCAHKEEPEAGTATLRETPQSAEEAEAELAMAQAQLLAAK